MVDEEAHCKVILYDIIDNRQDVKAIEQEDEFTEKMNGVNLRNMNTEGWKICIKWGYGSTNWVALKYIKQSYTVELADYAKWVKIGDKPEFTWWYTYVEKNRKIISPKVKSKYW